MKNMRLSRDVLYVDDIELQQIQKRMIELQTVIEWKKTLKERGLIVNYKIVMMVVRTEEQMEQISTRQWTAADAGESYEYLGTIVHHTGKFAVRNMQKSTESN